MAILGRDEATSSATATRSTPGTGATSSGSSSRRRRTSSFTPRSSFPGSSRSTAGARAWSSSGPRSSRSRGRCFASTSSRSIDGRRRPRPGADHLPRHRARHRATEVTTALRAPRHLPRRGGRPDRRLRRLGRGARGRRAELASARAPARLDRGRRPTTSRLRSSSGACSGSSVVESPEPLGGYVTWVERDGTQIHLIHTDGATVPVLGHAAVVVEDFEATSRASQTRGHEVEETARAVGRARAPSRSARAATGSS